jgi:hypothetical protein
VPQNVYVTVGKKKKKKKKAPFKVEILLGKLQLWGWWVNVIYIHTEQGQKCNVIGSSQKLRVVDKEERYAVL